MIHVMICPTCARGELVSTNEEEHVTVRVYRCDCGLYETLEVFQDRWKHILSSLGALYGAVKRLLDANHHDFESGSVKRLLEKEEVEDVG